MKLKISLLFFVLAVAMSCRGPRYYTVPDFEARTSEHKKVAILPVEMVFTGKQPEKLKPEDIAAIEEGESKAFQTSLFNNILAHASTRKGTIRVEFQTVEKTNEILAKYHMTIRESWAKDPVELAKILEVDAVVKTKIVKQRYMGDLASYGIQLGYNVLAQLGIMVWPVVMFTNGGKSNDIDAQCSLLNGKDGALLWKDMHKAGADWSRPANYIIEGITANFGYNFPYRVKSSK